MAIGKTDFNILLKVNTFNLTFHFVCRTVLFI